MTVFLYGVGFSMLLCVSVLNVPRVVPFEKDIKKPSLKVGMKSHRKRCILFVFDKHYVGLAYLAD